MTGHSIGMTMIEHPRIGEGNETVLRENMVVSMHPHAFTQDERTCLYMQDTWLVTAAAACRSRTCRSGSTTARRQRSSRPTC